MPRTPWLVALLLIAACPKRTEIIDLTNPANAPKSLLDCPVGTKEFGQLPPMGTEMWCAKDGSDGTQPVRHGPSRSWYSDGRPQAAGPYADGVRTGHWWYWTQEGHIEREGEYLNGSETGYWTNYRDDGTVVAEGPMKDGGKNGVWVSFDAANGVPQEGTWVDGQKDGTWVEYDAEGKATRERVFRLGRQISQHEL